MNRRGLSTQLWGAPVLSTNMEEVGIAIRTVWGLLVQKCYIQLQNVVLKPRMFSFPISLIWEIALNAEVNTKKQHFDAAFLMFKVSED